MEDSEKVQTLIKRAFDVTSTYKNTPWYDEEFARYQKILEAHEINVQTPPTVPTWETDCIDDNAVLSDFNVNIDNNNSFFAENTPFQDLHTLENSFFTKDAQKLPGAYLDTTKSVMLFIRLKLDKIDISGIDPNAIAYTKYSLDSSFNSVLDNAFQFNYNTQLDVSSGPSSTISVFKPYLYTLEYYSNTNLRMQQVTNNIGNWSFDFKSGIITFSNDPKDDNSSIDLSDGDLYFTFVKYIGARGLEKLIEVRENFDTSKPGFDNQIIVDSDNNSVFLYKPGNDVDSGWTPIGGRFDISGTDIFYTEGNVGIGTLLPSTNLDVSGSVIVSNTLTVHEDLVVDTDTFFVDSSKNMVGIGTTNPSYNLDVNGDANIASNLTVGGDISINQILDASSVNITNDLTVDGSLNIGNIDDVESKFGELDTSINLLETDISELDTSVNRLETITTDISYAFGTTTILNVLDVSGVLTVDRSANVIDDLTVGGDTEITGSLNIGSMNNIEGKINTLDNSVNALDNSVNALELHDTVVDASVNQLEVVTTDITYGSNMTTFANDVSVNGGGNITSNLTVGGDTEITGSLKIGSMNDIKGKINTLDNSVNALELHDTVVDASVNQLEVVTTDITYGSNITTFANDVSVNGGGEYYKQFDGGG